MLPWCGSSGAGGALCCVVASSWTGPLSEPSHGPRSHIDEHSKQGAGRHADTRAGLCTSLSWPHGHPLQVTRTSTHATCPACAFLVWAWVSFGGPPESSECFWVAHGRVSQHGMQMQYELIELRMGLRVAALTYYM